MLPPEEGPRSRGREWLLRLSLLGIAVLIAAGLGEFVMRLAVDMPLRMPQPQIRYDEHPVRRFTIRPSQSSFTFEARATIGPDGTRSNGGAPRTGARVRLIALGDSFTFGKGVEDDQTCPARMEQTLVGAGVDARVVNGGTISYSVAEEMHWLRNEGLGYRPQWVVHGLYWNDYFVNEPPKPGEASVLTPDGYFIWDDSQPRRGWRRIVGWLAERSALAFVAKQAVKTAMQRASGEAVVEREYVNREHRLEAGELKPIFWEPVQQFYRDLLAMGAEHGFRVFVIVFPVQGIVEQPQPTAHPYPVYIRAMLDSLGLPYLDGHAAFESAGLGGKDFLPYNRHLAASGYEAVCRAAATRLAALMRPESDSTPNP